MAAVEYASAAVEADPLRELAALTLVRALAAAGDPVAALTRYQQYRHALADELGLDPSEQAAALQHRLLSGVAGAAPRAARRGTALTELPFVGRDADLQAILIALERDQGSTILIEGTSGCGKSRLLRALAAELPTIPARASLPERAEPWSLVRSLLRELLAHDVTYRDRLSPRLDAALVTLLPELGPGTGTDADTDPETRRALLQQAALLLLAAADQVVALDDLQWADPTSLAVLETARGRLPGLRVVLAFRPEEIAESSALAAVLGRVRADLRVRLHGLTRTAIGQLVADQQLADALSEHTDRTPLAITEVLRALASEGRTVRDAANRWRGVEPDVIDRARELGEQGQRQAICARATRQPTPAREVLQLICLLAREVPVATLAAASGASEPEILDRLATLASAGLVRLGEIGWASSHDMVNEALTEQLHQGRRARLHAMLARALAVADEDPAELARHWRDAGEAGKSARAYARAAQRALDAYADREAANLADDGLALAPPAPLAALLREVRAQARTRFGDLSGAREDLRAALAAHRTGSDRARLLGRLAMLASGSDDLVRADKLAELALLEAGTDHPARAQALEIAAVLDMNLDRNDRASLRFAEALQLYECLGDAHGTARVLDAQAMATFLAGDIHAGGAALRQAADLFEDSGELVRVLTPRSTSGHALVFGGRAADGLAATTAALDLARILGHPEGQAYALWHRTEALAALHRPGEAMSNAREALAIATKIGHRGWTATSWRAVGIAAQAAGDLDAALRAYLTSLDLSEHLDLFASWAAARAALVLITLGDLNPAVPLVSRALAEGPPLGHYEARLAQAELAAATEDPRAGELARAALTLADQGGAVQGRPRLADLASTA